MCGFCVCVIYEGRGNVYVMGVRYAYVPVVCVQGESACVQGGGGPPGIFFLLLGNVPCY